MAYGLNCADGALSKASQSLRDKIGPRGGHRSFGEAWSEGSVRQGLVQAFTQLVSVVCYYYLALAANAIMLVNRSGRSRDFKSWIIFVTTILTSASD